MANAQSCKYLAITWSSKADHPYLVSWVRENKVKDDFSKILVNVVSKAPEPSEETVTPNAYVVTLPSMRAAETFVGDVDHLSSILASIQTRQDVGCLWEDDARRIRKVLACQKSKAEGHIHQMLGEERQSRKETPNQPTMSYEEDLWNTAKGHWAQAENWAAAAERDSRTV